jgi:hypothetical protein
VFVLAGRPCAMSGCHDAAGSAGGADASLDAAPSGSAGAAGASASQCAAASQHRNPGPSAAPVSAAAALAAVGDAGASTAEHADEAGLASPEALVGRRVHRHFPWGSFVGEIVSTRATPDFGQLWSVCYEDDDEEDLDWDELRAALLPAAACELPDAAGAGGSSAAAGVSPAHKAAALPTSGTSAADSQPPASERRYKGEYSIVSSTPPFKRIYYAVLWIDGRSQNLGSFCTAVKAARAYDAAARAHGILTVNFPRAGSEEQAVHGRQAILDAVHVSQGLAAAQQYKGVTFAKKGAPGRQYRVQLCSKGVHVLLGGFATALDAARAFDERARSLGRLQLNFPKPGTAETQAVRGVADWSGTAVAPGIHAAAEPRDAHLLRQSILAVPAPAVLESTRRSSQPGSPPPPAADARGPAPAPRSKRARAPDEDEELPSSVVEPPAKASHIVQPHRSGSLPPDEHAAAAAGGADATGVDAPRCSQPHESPFANAHHLAPAPHSLARMLGEDAVDLPSPVVSPAAAVSPPRTAPPAARVAHTQLRSPSSSAGAAVRCSPAGAVEAPAAADAGDDDDDDMVDASPLAAPRYIVPPLAAAGPLQAGGASTPLEVPPDCPESLVGRRVMCTYPEGVLSGAVIHTRATQAHGQLWCVALEDGEEEELTWSELCAALQPLQPLPLHAPPPPHAAAPPAAPPAAAAVAPPEGDGDPAEDASLAPVAAFLRAITPPLSQLSAALAALPDSGVSMAHLACIASSPHTASADRKMLFDELTSGLGLTRAADRFAFMHAVLALAPRAAATRDA